MVGACRFSLAEDVFAQRRLAVHAAPDQHQFTTPVNAAGLNSGVIPLLMLRVLSSVPR